MPALYLQFLMSRLNANRNYSRKQIEHKYLSN